jgi:predicted phosphodiesterase
VKILIVADEESRSLWDYFSPEKLKGIDMIISCGDLNANYLQFLVTFGNCPLLYVRGNHDTRYEMNPPDGCICIEDKIFNYKGMRIAGLGGSMKYKNSPNMFTEREMRARWRRLRRKIIFTGGIDLLVTHAPAKGYGDMEDLPHRGFDCFNDL